MTYYYTGIGSRETPRAILKAMYAAAQKLSATHVLRSGAAKGADTAFEYGANGNWDIYIPWRSFSANPRHINTSILPNFNQAMRIASAHHPAWHLCSHGARMLHTRNVYQILGTDLASPSQFVLMWAPQIEYEADSHQVKSCSGGTGQAVRIARAYGVPVYCVQDNFIIPESKP